MRRLRGGFVIGPQSDYRTTVASKTGSRTLRGPGALAAHDSFPPSRAWRWDRCAAFRAGAGFNAEEIVAALDTRPSHPATICENDHLTRSIVEQPDRCRANQQQNPNRYLHAYNVRRRTITARLPHTHMLILQAEPVRVGSRLRLANIVRVDRDRTGLATNPRRNAIQPEAGRPTHPAGQRPVGCEGQ